MAIARGTRHVAIVGFVLALTALLWVAAGAVNRFYPGHAPDPRNPADRVTTEHASFQYSVDDIVTAHLFGEEKTVEKSVVEQAPETRLQLRLLGVVASPDHNLARAMIAVDRGKVGVYGVSDAINNSDAKVRAVEAQRVLLERGGAVESLSLQRKGVEMGRVPG